jgi:hypothetical protein
LRRDLIRRTRVFGHVVLPRRVDQLCKRRSAIARALGRFGSVCSMPIAASPRRQGERHSAAPNTPPGRRLHPGRTRASAASSKFTLTVAVSVSCVASCSVIAGANPQQWRFFQERIEFFEMDPQPARKAEQKQP